MILYHPYGCPEMLQGLGGNFGLIATNFWSLNLFSNFDNERFRFFCSHTKPWKGQVWAKPLKSEWLKLQNSVNNKKCLFYYIKNMCLKISNSIFNQKQDSIMSKTARILWLKILLKLKIFLRLKTSSTQNTSKSQNASISFQSWKSYVNMSRLVLNHKMTKYFEI